MCSLLGELQADRTPIRADVDSSNERHAFEYDLLRLVSPASRRRAGQSGHNTMPRKKRDRSTVLDSDLVARLQGLLLLEQLKEIVLGCLTGEEPAFQFIQGNALYRLETVGESVIDLIEVR